MQNEQPFESILIKRCKLKGNNETTFLKVNLIVCFAVHMNGFQFVRFSLSIHFAVSECLFVLCIRIHVSKRPFILLYQNVYSFRPFSLAFKFHVSKRPFALLYQNVHSFCPFSLRIQFQLKLLIVISQPLSDTNLCSVNP